MQQVKNKKYSITFWALSVVCMMMIFFFSSRTADESSMQSSIILELIEKIFKTQFDENSIMHIAIRKLAHFSEFAGLSLLLNCAMFFTKNKKQLLASTIFTSAYAVTDEIHQIFVEGRACQFVDWLIDTAGAITGAIAFLIICLIIKKIINKRGKTNEHISI